MEEKKKDDIQSRREFFKEASIRLLPLLGAIVIANPIKAIMRDDAVPSGYCRAGCFGYCITTCKDSCDVVCTYYKSKR